MLTLDVGGGVFRDRRAVSPVISVVLMVAVVVVLAATTSVFVLGLGESVSDPSPTVAQSSGEFAPQDGFDGGIVNITHQAGDTVSTSALEIAVTAECEGGQKRGRLVDLPATSGNAISDDQIEGANIFDQLSLNRYGGGALLDSEYSAGETILFRIPKSKCELTSGSEVTVRVVHTPTEGVIIDRALTA